MQLAIADALFADYPELVLGVVIAHGLTNTPDQPELTALLRAAETALPAKFGGVPVIEHPHILPWREAYRKFGAKPRDYPSSVENLARRVLNGAQFPHINNLVCLYNTISLRHLLPVGGEDLDTISGDVRLTYAGDAEPAVVLLGEKDAHAPRPGEIIYTDALGAICRRWNWKEADRTKLTPETRHAVLVIEALPPVARGTVAAAIHELAELVQRYCGGAVSTAFLDTQQRAVTLK
jgi:DNA/RNA-binding domain of Phe-tRNA-synthetase-like protein